MPCTSSTVSHVTVAVVIGLDGVEHRGHVRGAAVPGVVESPPGEESRDRVGVKHPELGRLDNSAAHTNESLASQRLELSGEVADRVGPEERSVTPAIDPQRGEATRQIEDTKVRRSIVERPVPGRAAEFDRGKVGLCAVRVDYLEGRGPGPRVRDARRAEPQHVEPIGLEAQLLVGEPPFRARKSARSKFVSVAW